MTDRTTTLGRAGPPVFAACVLADLESGRAVPDAAAALAAADPGVLRHVVGGWPSGGTVARVRDLWAGAAPVTECATVLAGEPAWAVALLMALDADRGEQVAAHLMAGASRPLW